jgi:2-oxo-4-hydroxy-4-carboxy-5-ureidoimidazoline decarboxylase
MSKCLFDLNACSRHEFVAALGNVFEYAPWIVERAASARPFDGVQHLFNVMKTVVDQTAPELRLALIRGHPDLANKAQRAAASPQSPMPNRVALDWIGCRIQNLRRLSGLTVPTAPKKDAPA